MNILWKNPTKEFISFFDELLSPIPQEFIKKEISEDIYSAKITIFNSDKSDKIIFTSSNGSISYKYENTTKKYSIYCFTSKSKILKICSKWRKLKNPQENQKDIKMTVNQVAVTICEPNTGIMLAQETLERYVGWGTLHKFFDSFELAKEFIYAEKRELEFVIFNFKYEYIDTIYF